MTPKLSSTTNALTSQICTNNKENDINEGLVKRITELESELIKEKAVVQVLTAEKEGL